MDSKELYEKYAGRKADFNGDEGVICGYDADGACMIMAVTKISDTYSDGGWDDESYADTIFTHKDNSQGYWFVDEEDIID